MLLKYYKTHAQWLEGKPEYEDVEYSKAYARIRIDVWLSTGGYAVEQHQIETITFKIWRAGDEKHLENS